MLSFVCGRAPLLQGPLLQGPVHAGFCGLQAVHGLHASGANDLVVGFAITIGI